MVTTLDTLEEVARHYVLHEPPYCLKFPSSNCKTQRRYLSGRLPSGHREQPCIKCRLREALGIEFVKHQPEGRWWEEVGTYHCESLKDEGPKRKYARAVVVAADGSIVRTYSGAFALADARNEAERLNRKAAREEAHSG